MFESYYQNGKNPRTSWSNFENVKQKKTNRPEVVIFRTRRLSKNRLKGFEIIKPDDGLELPSQFGNSHRCELCGIGTNSEDHFSKHIAGKKHSIRKFLSKVDFTTITNNVKADQRLVSEPFLHSLCENTSNLCAYGVEHFVEFVENDTLYLYSTATAQEFELPLYKTPDKELEEEGELPNKQSSEVPDEYFQFLDSIQMNYHLAHSIRNVDLSLFKSMTNWPHVSPQLPTMRKKGEFTARDALPMQVIIPGQDQAKERRMPEPQWKLKEQSEIRTKVAEYCKDQQKSYSPLKIQLLLKKIQKITDRIEYENIKKNTENVLMLFREDCEFERQKRSQERRNFEEKMTREENLLKESHKRLNSKKKGIPNETSMHNQNSIPTPFLNKHSPWPSHNQAMPISSNKLVAPPPVSKKIADLKPLGGKPIPPTPEEMAKQLSAFGNVLATKSENELAGLTKDQESALRKLIPLYTKIIKRQSELRELANRELRLRDREHKPIKKLQNSLEAAKTSTFSDLYFLFTKANMRYRPRTVRVEPKNGQYGFAIHQLDNAGVRIIYFSNVEPHQAAYIAGIKRGDRIVEINEKSVDDLSFEQVKQEVKTSTAEQGGVRFLLSDPETDKYIQEGLELPVLRFQVQSTADPAKITEEWQKFRKKQGERRLGFFYPFDKMQNKLNCIKPDRPPSPIISELVENRNYQPAHSNSQRMENSDSFLVERHKRDKQEFNRSCGENRDRRDEVRADKRRRDSYTELEKRFGIQHPPVQRKVRHSSREQDKFPAWSSSHYQPNHSQSIPDIHQQRLQEELPLWGKPNDHGEQRGRWPEQEHHFNHHNRPDDRWNESDYNRHAQNYQKRHLERHFSPPENRPNMMGRFPNNSEVDRSNRYPNY